MVGTPANQDDQGGHASRQAKQVFAALFGKLTAQAAAQ